MSTRQLHYHNLLWQVPVLSMTAQAFLFSVILDSSSSMTARLISASLSLVTAGASMQLMARHRQADVSDSHWLAHFERENLSEEHWIHGPPWKRQRDAFSAGGPLARFPYSFVIWMTALGAFALGAILVIVLSLTGPSLLSG